MSSKQAHFACSPLAVVSRDMLTWWCICDSALIGLGSFGSTREWRGMILTQQVRGTVFINVYVKAHISAVGMPMDPKAITKL